MPKVADNQNCITAGCFLYTDHMLYLKLQLRMNCLRHVEEWRQVCFMAKEMEKEKYRLTGVFRQGEDTLFSVLMRGKASEPTLFIAV